MTDLFASDPQSSHSTYEEWSFSRRAFLFQCPRKYYYLYFGSNARTAKAEPLKARLKELKPLTSVYVRGGQILDLIIRTYYLSVQKGEQWSLNRLENWALDIFRKDRDFNSRPKFIPAVGRFPPVRLLEYYYRLPDAQAQYEKAESKLVTAIRNFIQSSHYRVCHNYGTRPGARIQHTLRLSIDGATARGKLDLAFQGPVGFEIIDWKMGTDNGADENLQVGFYGLWASEQPDIQAPVRLTMAYLGEGSAKHFDLQQIRPRVIRARIIQDLNIMRALRPFGVAANAEAFTPCGQARICIQCPFQSVCPMKE